MGPKYTIVWTDKNKLDPSKTNWTDQNRFGPIERQGISVLFTFSKGYLIQ